MKDYFKTLKYLLALSIIMVASPLLANNLNHDVAFNKTNIADGVEGAWHYTVENVSPEYSEGILVISMENKEYKINIQLANGNIMAEGVEVTNNEVKFHLYVEGTKVSVSLTVDGDSISGESSSVDGVFAIKGRRAQPE